ncbi:MAG: hypothetical protein SPL42_09870 [Bacteroidales bacterium]|nr:hypothetical protein [Bacteroidales bacterium]MDY6348712.1 hypothetical protein [Bacteroidales bacterium]
MIEILPETTVHLEKDNQSYENWDILHLPNVDVVIKQYGHTYISFFDETGSKNLDYENLHAPVTFLKEINDRMPAWKAEFGQLFLQNADGIRKRERKRQKLCIELYQTSFERTYLRGRLTDTLLMTRYSLNAPYRILENLKSVLPKDIDPSRVLQSSDVSVKIDFNNFSLNIFRACGGRLRLCMHFQNYSLELEYKLLTKEMLQQIDAQLPVWLSETQKILYDVQKKEKACQIGRNSIRILVKQRMKEKGWEYLLSTENDNLLLTVKLQKKRMLKVTLPADNLERATRLLAELGDYVSAIDSVPMNFRISFQSNKMSWERENTATK